MGRIQFPTLLVAVLLVGFLAAYAVTTQVRFNEVGVRVKLGQASPETVIREPGWYFRWPWPIESIKTYDSRLRTTDTPEAEIKTLDGKNLIVSAFALWKIKDPHKYYVQVVDDNEAVRQLRTRLGQARSAAIGRRDMSYFVSLQEETVEANWAELEREILETAAPQIEKDYGIELVDVGIRRVSLPEQVTATVFQAMSQNANKLATQYREEGKSFAEAIRARAEADRRQILAFAATKAQEIRSQGIQAATRILAQLEQEDQEFFRFQQMLAALRTALAQRSTIVLDSSNPLWQPLVQPLKKVAPLGFPGSAAEEGN